MTAAARREAQRVRLLRGCRHQADKRLVEHLLAKGSQPKHIANALAWRRALVAHCLKADNGGRVLVAELADHLDGSRWTHGRHVKLLVELPDGPHGPDYTVHTDRQRRQVLVVEGFAKLHQRAHERRRGAERAGWRQRKAAQRQREAGSLTVQVCSSTLPQSADRQPTEHLPKMSREYIEALSDMPRPKDNTSDLASAGLSLVGGPSCKASAAERRAWLASRPLDELPSQQQVHRKRRLSVTEQLVAAEPRAPDGTLQCLVDIGYKPRSMAAEGLSDLVLMGAYRKVKRAYPYQTDVVRMVVHAARKIRDGAWLAPTAA